MYFVDIDFYELEPWLGFGVRRDSTNPPRSRSVLHSVPPIERDR
jgi:hypothetical protein